MAEVQDHGLKITSERRTMCKEVAVQTSEEASNEITNYRYKSNKISFFFSICFSFDQWKSVILLQI